MNASTNIMPEASAVTSAATNTARPFLWSVRRELWANRSLFVAPIAVASVLLAAIALGMLRAGGRISPEVLARLDATQLRGASVGFFMGISSSMMIAMVIVVWFYLLDALHSERRDRSVLFWKSLPVSDLTTVLSKVFVAMIVAPVIALAVTLTLHVVGLLVASIWLTTQGGSGLGLISNSELISLVILFAYTALVGALWAAPIYGWLLFVSSWARRTPFLWAVLPPALLGIAEGIALGTNRVWKLIGERLSGGLTYAFDRPDIFRNANVQFQPTQVPDHLLQAMDPVTFLSQPGLWIGLSVAAAFIAGSIWMRRYREPL
jgi:ABC-2 type transport system permease protein